MEINSRNFYGYLLKLVSLDCNYYDTMFESRTYFDRDELTMIIWKNTGGTSDGWFDKFMKLGFIKKVFDEKKKKKKYCIEVKLIKKFIKDESIFAEILKKINDKEPMI